MTMFAFLLSMALQTPGVYTPPPAIPGKPACTCPANSRPDVTVSGYVVDAQVILGADRRSVEERMATIFDVTQASDSTIRGRTKIWHNVSEESCGVTFDYGKRYSVPARYDAQGELETDSCLLGG